MIIVRTPFRISYAGGGTDFYDYYKDGESIIFSTTIDKYIYVTLNKRFDGKLHLRYSKTEEVDVAEQLEHTMVKEALRMFGIRNGIEIVIISDIPAKGSGLGSSSALAVCLIEALYCFIHKGGRINKHELAIMACDLEINKLKSPIGKQDQYACSFGGFNKIIFKKNRTEVFNLMETERISYLENNTLLFHLNIGRDSNNILLEHKNNIHEKRKTLDKIKNLALNFHWWLDMGKYEWAPGSILNLSWVCKKTMSDKCTSSVINAIVENAVKVGCLGAKLCGAGGGGFLMVICEDERKKVLRTSFSGFHELKFKFSKKGSEVIFNDNVY